MSMIAVLSGVAVIGLLHGIVVAWLYSLYHFCWFAWRYRRLRGTVWLDRAAWSAPDLPPAVALHRRRFLFGIWTFVGCVIGIVLIYLVGEFVTWATGGATGGEPG